MLAERSRVRAGLLHLTGQQEARRHRRAGSAGQARDRRHACGSKGLMVSPCHSLRDSARTEVAGPPHVCIHSPPTSLPHRAISE